MRSALLSTSEFAAALGISESSVRRMADAGDLPMHRTRGGHRRIPVAEALRYVREQGATLVRPELLGLIAPAADPGSADSAAPILAALLAGRASGVTGRVQSMYAGGMSIAAICDGPIQQALQAIGDRWPRDKKAIFVEHRATLLCMRALCQMRLAMVEPEENAPTALGAAPTDDPYLLPSLMVSLVLHDCGFDETNLGPDTPLDVLSDCVEDERPALVWLALTNPIRSRTQHREVERLAATVKACQGQLLIGGRGSLTYEGRDAVRCASMSELEQRARRFPGARRLRSLP